MRRFAVAMAGLALVAAIQAPAAAADAAADADAAAAAARSTAAPDTGATAKPSAKPSPGPSRSKSSPAPPPARSSVQTVPPPVAAEPLPNSNCPPSGQTVSSQVTGVPWAQQALDFTSAWPLTEGQGVTVAVVDSGVDYTSQLQGRVTAHDFTGTGLADCVGHGTAIAAIIAASDQQGQGNSFEGVAPEARILSVKVNDQETGTAATLAQGIRYAATLKAGVINVSVTTRNVPELASAVAFAIRQGSVIVASGGNDAEGENCFGRCYPASYPGVLSVGAVASDGSLGPFSNPDSNVAVTAPGVNVTSAYPGSGFQVNDLNGTSYATAFVSGVAALVRAHYPRMSAAEVVRRIELTANGNAGPGTGDGLVDPLQAVTAIVPPAAAQSPQPGRPQPVPVARAPRPDRAVIDTALEVAAGTLGAAAVIVLLAVVVSYGRRRRWRAG
jgi:membrane-anchored mycosin MYCP